MTEKNQKLITQKYFADLAGVTPAAITFLKNRSPEMFVGTKVNLNHPLAKAYIQQQHLKSSDVLISPPAKIEGEGNQNNIASRNSALPEIPDEIANLTLFEIVSTYGGIPGFQQFMTAHEKLAAYRNKQLKWERDRHELVYKKHEAKVIFEVVEQLFKRFVNELPVTQSQKSVSIAQENRPDAAFKIQAMIRQTNSNVLKICKNRLIKKLQIDRDEELERLFKKTAKSLLASEGDDIPYEILS